MAEPPSLPGPPGLPEPTGPNLRIGNPERQVVLDRLSAALDDGRLELLEYDERVQQVYAARTYADLAPITADLPAPAPPPPPRPSLASRLRLTGPERAWLAMSVVLTAIWGIGVFDGDPDGFWPIYPIGIWGAVLLARRIAGH